MESTVINQPQQQPPQESANPTGSNNTTAQPHVGGGGGHQPQQHQQQYTPQSAAGHEPGQNEDPRFRAGQNPFFFDMDDPRDFFTNPALRTRLSRFQNPWNSMFGQRKRRTSPPTSAGAPADRDDFFQSHFDAPHWNEPRGWPPMNGARAGAKSNADMFNYIPEEFRQYMPDQFGFSHHHQAAPPPQPPPAPHHRQSSVHTPSAQPQAPQSQQPPPQQQEQYNKRVNSGDLRRPKFCDAGMQTDDVSPSESASNIHENEARAQHTQQQQSELPPRGNTPQQAPPTASAEPNQPGYARSFADTGVGSSPNGSFASAHAYATTGDGQRPARSNSNSMGNVRRVPIIVEGQPSSLPKESYMPHRSPPNHQQSSAAPEQQQAPRRPPPPTAREVPIQRPVEPPSPSVVSINKIQDIQQDVLNLMFKVEQYKGGNKEDKEYKYLDEMLTRNLLKLDTIDTRGNDSIRLARKEAIKCIQASLNVLEAKLDGRPKEEETASDGNAEKEVEQVEKEEVGGVDVKEENRNKDGDAEQVKKSTDEVDKSKIPIPLPGIPGQVPPPTIRDCNSDDEDEKAV